MDIPVRHPWPATPEEAEAIQDRLRPLLELADPGPAAPATVAGVDVSYEDGTDRLAAAVVVLGMATLQPIEESVVIGAAAFPYVPGLFAFRELPTLIEALENLSTTPDLLVCDGHGRAHPRRFGLACHLGVLTGLPSMGIAKTRLLGTRGPAAHRPGGATGRAADAATRAGLNDPPDQARGSVVDLWDDGEIVGRVLRTQDGVRPVYVSVGHKIGLDTACRLALALSPRYRLPETTRRADRLSRDALRSGAAGIL